MECRLRTDMEPTDPPEAVCYCIKDEPICGTDGITYENECQLTESRYKKRDGLVAASRGPCKSGKSSNMNYTIFLINSFQIIPFLTNKLIFMNIKVFFFI